MQNIYGLEVVSMPSYKVIWNIIYRVFIVLKIQYPVKSINVLLIKLKKEIE